MFRKTWMTSLTRIVSNDPSNPNNQNNPSDPKDWMSGSFADDWSHGIFKTPTSNFRPGPEYHCTDAVAQHISPNYLAGDYLHGPGDDEGCRGGTEGRLIRTRGWSTVVIITQGHQHQQWELCCSTFRHSISGSGGPDPRPPDTWLPQIKRTRSHWIKCPQKPISSDWFYAIRLHLFPWYCLAVPLLLDWKYLNIFKKNISI